MNVTFDRVKRFPRKCTRNLFIKVRSINQIFEGLDKQCVIPSQRFLTPEVESMRFFPLAEELKKPCYDSPEGYLTILPRVIYNARSNILTTTAKEILSDSINAGSFRYKFSIRETYYSKLTYLPTEKDFQYSIFRSHHTNYYHTIIDNLPRLYLLGRLKNVSIKLLFPSQLTNVERFFIDKLRPSNVSIELVEPNKSYVIDKLVFSSFLTRHFSGYLPREYLVFFRERVLPKRPRKKINRIFIARGPNQRNSRGQRRRFLNEDAVFRSLQKIGFQKYRLEDLSIEEQVDLFYDAEFVVGAHGAGMTNIIFSEAIGVLELFSNDCVLPYYYYLSKSLGHKYSFLYGDSHDIHADFSVNIAEVMKVIETFGLTR